MVMSQLKMKIAKCLARKARDKEVLSSGTEGCQFFKLISRQKACLRLFGRRKNFELGSEILYVLLYMNRLQHNQRVTLHLIVPLRKGVVSPKIELFF